MPLNFYPLAMLEYATDLEALLKLLRRREFDRPVLFARHETWATKPLYYSLSAQDLKRAAPHVDQASVDEIFDILNVHETTLLEVVARGQQPPNTALVVDDAESPLGVWLHDAQVTPSHSGQPEVSIANEGSHASPPVAVVPPGPAGHALKQVLFRRTPHMDVAGEPLTPGQTFEATVYVDKSPQRTDERSVDVEIDAPETVTEFALEVKLVTTSHFTIVGDSEQPLNVKRNEDKSPPISFEVKVGDKVSNGSNAALTALFTYAHRPCGRVDRHVKIAGTTRPSVRRSTGRSESATDFAIDGFAKPADLSVDVIEAPDGDGSHYLVKVRTTIVKDFGMKKWEAWNFPEKTSSIVEGLMDEFTRAGAGPFERKAALKGAGLKLWEKAPSCFKMVFWRLIDAGTPPRSISIVSAEPNIPWELMRPWRDRPNPVKRDPLGMEFLVGRWPHEGHRSPKQQLPIDDSYVVAPKYSGARKLASADAEAQFICDRFSGLRVDPAEQARLEALLKQRPVALLHFICHGSSDGGTQKMQLDGTAVFSATQVRGMDALEEACRTKAPFVFLNACEVGRTTPALVGTGGFAVEFINAGARCVIAPLWSVKDTLAHEVAVDFYEAVLAKPDRPFADILAEIRRRSLDREEGEDTYAAYALYGDPLTALQPVS